MPRRDGVSDRLAIRSKLLFQSFSGYNRPFSRNLYVPWDRAQFWQRIRANPELGLPQSRYFSTTSLTMGRK